MLSWPIMSTIPSVNDQPAWDLSPEYDSFEDTRFAGDLAEVKRLLAELESREPRFATALDRAEALDPKADAELLAACAEQTRTGESAAILFSNLATYASCVGSVDGKDVKAKEYRGVFSSLDARIDKAYSSLELLLARASEAFVAAFLALPGMAPQAFRIGQLRKYRDRLLPLGEEKVISSLTPDGQSAWGSLYDAISGTAKCRLELRGETREIGLAEAASLWRDPDPAVREAAYRAQAATFTQHEESLAAILNSLAGFRLAEYELRSKKAKVHFLDAALAQNRMGAATLDAMLSAVERRRELGREALRLQARLAGVERFACWDILAPAPALPGAASASAYSFAEGFALVKDAYRAVHPAMGDFVESMLARRRIEARVLPAKRPGAYCTGFLKSRSRFVFQTYKGSLSDVSTLAHELGHAYHGELLSKLPLAEISYPMTLAETASTFAETALGDYLEGRSRDLATRLELGWSDAQDATTFLVNIPARFAFEKAFYEKRAEKPLGPAALSELMLATMREHYGDSLREHDAHFWKSKLHFYMSGRSFYNFPYTFGYLFSLGVYARRAALGEGFHDSYAALLRDTGRMEVEELALRHFGADLTKPDFWEASLGIVETKVGRFSALVEEIEGGRS